MTRLSASRAAAIGIAAWTAVPSSMLVSLDARAAADPASVPSAMPGVATAGPTPANGAPIAAPAPLASPPPLATTAPPADAEAALERARAAYEYGEMEVVVDSARLVADGRLPPTPPERARALRYLGIGLYLTGRQEGAETAFFDLLRLHPYARLDATTTRPDVVAFFEDVRRRHAAEINEAASRRPGKNLTLAFLPPAGQFQSGHTARGITIASLEGLSLITTIGTYVQLKAWDKYPGHTFAPPIGQPGTSHADAARTLKAINNGAGVVFAATVIIGIIDGLASYMAVEPEDSGKSIADAFGRGYAF